MILPLHYVLISQMLIALKSVILEININGVNIHRPKEDFRETTESREQSMSKNPRSLNTFTFHYYSLLNIYIYYTFSKKDIPSAKYGTMARQTPVIALDIMNIFLRSKCSLTAQHMITPTWSKHTAMAAFANRFPGSWLVLNIIAKYSIFVMILKMYGKKNDRSRKVTTQRQCWTFGVSLSNTRS